jgi:hypothetical protein
MYLAPYSSPDLNPIEEAFSLSSKRCSEKSRSAYPRGAHRGDGPSSRGAVTASDARGFFEHRGYRAEAHLL